VIAKTRSTQPKYKFITQNSHILGKTRAQHRVMNIYLYIYTQWKWRWYITMACFSWSRRHFLTLDSRNAHWIILPYRSSRSHWVTSAPALDWNEENNFRNTLLTSRCPKLHTNRFQRNMRKKITWDEKEQYDQFKLNTNTQCSTISILANLNNQQFCRRNVSHSTLVLNK